MYDFYFGDKEDIFKNEENVLISIKRMMPRWCNSIPDSEFLAIHHDLQRSPVVEKNSRGVIIETGCGASTIVLAYSAFKYGKKLYTWDINQNKLSYIRAIISDTLEKLFRKSLFDIWTYVPYLSTSPELGIGIVSEMGETIDFGFFDSEHTAEVLNAELELAIKNVNNKAVLALDDANYRYKKKNTAYINVFRKKLGLQPVKEDPENIGETFFSLAEKLITSKYPSSKKLDDTYKKNYRNDIFWEYFSSDRKIMDSLGMEKLQELEHRYDSFQIVK